ncbi:MAG: putative oxidoreductase [Glaciihabitans sp.]|nr:putative oxidoreductase [Glaciihabitans sp.]
MSTSAPIRTGLVGFGLAGRVFHEPFLRANPAFDLRVIATSDPARAAEAKGRGDYQVVPTPEELLAMDLDLVVLASPASVHLAQATAALENGAAVVVDKPFVPSVADAESLIATSERVGKPLIVFQNRRWDGDFLTVKALLDSGRLGNVFRFESTFERFAGAAQDRWQDTTGPSTGAGIVFDLGSHLVDQALQLFGEATLVDADLKTLRPGGASEDDASLVLAHKSGVTSHITVSRMAAQAGPRFRVLGTESAYTVYGLDNQEDQLKSGLGPHDAGFAVTPAEDWGLVGGGDGQELVPEPTLPGDYAGFYAGVAATIRDGARSPVDVRSSLEALRILEQAHQFRR